MVHESLIEARRAQDTKGETLIKPLSSAKSNTNALSMYASRGCAWEEDKSFLPWVCVSPRV